MTLNCPKCGGPLIVAPGECLEDRLRLGEGSGWYCSGCNSYWRIAFEVDLIRREKR